MIVNYCFYLELHDVEKTDESKDSVNNDVTLVCNQDPDIFLTEMINCYNTNITRPKQGHRFSYEMKMYAAYQRMLGGRLWYETFKSNATHAVPSIRSIDRYIAQAKSNVMEGILRADELLKYLKDLNLPKFVSLSEDATRINDRIQYDSATNQLVGFVLPLNPENGMPIADSYHANSAADIERCFYDVKTGAEKKRSTNINVVMAQPLVKSIPAFCILIFGTDSKYTTDDIVKRWAYIEDELAKRNIKVVSFASDSDPKFNSAMRRHLKLGQCTSPLPEWFNAEYSFNINFVTFQDEEHIGTKFRNRVLNREMKIGKYKITVDHLNTVIKSYPKNEHNLCASTVAPTDRQNFDSVLRICDEKVINLLRNVSESEGIILYLKVLSNILRSFLDMRLSPIERIRLLWFSTFVLRIWKKFITSHDTYTLEKHFISLNSYTCVEINAHSIINLISFLRDQKLDHLFHPEMFGSQQCESIFRQIRSMSSTYSTVTNSSLLEIIQKLSKIELQNEISHIKLKGFNFPRIGLQSSSYYPTVDRNGQDRYNFTWQLPTENEIIKEIELAKIEAIEYAESVGIPVKPTDSYICKFPILKKKTCPEEAVNREDDTLSEPSTGDDMDKELLQLFSDINLREYSHKKVSGKIDQKSQFVKVRNKKGEVFYVKKHTLCWLFGKSTSKLSSDRVLRVMAPKK